MAHYKNSIWFVHFENEGHDRFNTFATFNELKLFTMKQDLLLPTLFMELH